MFLTTTIFTYSTNTTIITVVSCINEIAFVLRLQQKNLFASKKAKKNPDAKKNNFVKLCYQLENILTLT